MKGNKGLRMCVVCHHHKNKSDLIRICKDTINSSIVIDMNNSFQSRGFYICNDEQCLNKFINNNIYVRFFKNLDKVVVENSLKEIIALHE